MRNQAIERQKEFRAKLKELEYVEILEFDEPCKSDPTKICFRIEGLEGSLVRQQLKDIYLIDPENANAQMVLISFHIGTSSEIVDELFEAIKSIKNTSGDFPQILAHKSDLVKSTKLPIPEYRFSINEVFQKKWVPVQIKDSVGRVSASIQSPCPPGCIILDIGEIIT